MKNLLMTSTLAVIFATSSYAGGLSPPIIFEPPIQAPPQVTSTWSGPYAGLTYGQTSRRVEKSIERWGHRCEHGTGSNTHNNSKCVITEDNFNTLQVQSITGDPSNSNPDVVSYYGDQENLNWGDYCAIWVPEGKSYQWVTLYDTGIADNPKGGVYSVSKKTIDFLSTENNGNLGAFAGYRHEVGPTVLGVEAGFNGDLKSIEAQVGLDVDQFLPYAFAGVGQYDGEDTNVYGAGADFKVNEKVFIGGKYANGDFGEQVTIRIGFNF